MTDVNQIAGKPVLVTGATGFVGTHLTRRLIELGAKVSILARATSDKDLIAEFKEAGVNVVTGDVTDAESVDQAVRDQDYVFHIAALFREAKFPDSIYYDVNVDGAKNVLDAAEKHGVTRVVHCSTIGVHSHIINPPADETEDYRPGDIYQETKAEGEKLALARFRSGQVDGVVIRPAMIWGEGDQRMLKLYKGVSKRTFPMIGDGKTLTHWIYVHDLVQGFLLAALTPEAKGEVYIIAGERPIPLEEVVQTIADVAGVKPPFLKIPAWPIQLLGSIVEVICKPFGIEPPIYRRRVDFFTKDRCFDTSKAQSQLGFKPANTFAQEVENIYKWYDQQGWLK